jgi:predicted lipid-binding transport protein (Tim44 family)
MVGLLSGIAGSWIGHMIFGATESTARTNEAGDRNGEAGQTAPGFNGMLLTLVMLLGAGTLYFMSKGRRRAAPSISGMRQANAAHGSFPASSTALLPASTVDTEITSADKAAFQQLLVDIQTSWSQHDLNGLRRFVTPEMLGYFSTALAEQTSQDLANHVEDVVLLHAEARECWMEGTTEYATVLLHWSARDYTVSLLKQPGESGYLIEGSDVQPTETTEVWTFMRAQRGKWLLSAIQQVA